MLSASEWDSLLRRRKELVAEKRSLENEVHSIIKQYIIPEIQTACDKRTWDLNVGHHEYYLSFLEDAVVLYFQVEEGRIFPSCAVINQNLSELYEVLRERYKIKIGGFREGYSIP